MANDNLNLSRGGPIKISVQEISAITGFTVTMIQQGLRQGKLPFGEALPPDVGSTQWRYICVRPAFWHWVDYGDTSVVNEIHIQREDFDTLARAIVAR